MNCQLGRQSLLIYLVYLQAGNTYGTLVFLKSLLELFSHLTKVKERTFTGCDIKTFDYLLLFYDLILFQIEKEYFWLPEMISGCYLFLWQRYYFETTGTILNIYTEISWQWVFLFTWLLIWLYQFEIDGYFYITKSINFDWYKKWQNHGPAAYMKWVYWNHAIKHNRYQNLKGRWLHQKLLLYQFKSVYFQSSAMINDGLSLYIWNNSFL